jgi:hypothetical protein
MAQISASCKANVAPISQQQFTRPSLWWYVASRRGHDHMVDGFTTTCAISVYHHCEFEPRSWRGVLDTTLCDKVCQWLATGRWFSPGTPVSSTNKTDRHYIAEILLKVALNTTTLTPSYIILYRYTSKNVLYYIALSHRHKKIYRIHYIYRTIRFKLLFWYFIAYVKNVTSNFCVCEKRWRNRC